MYNGNKRSTKRTEMAEIVANMLRLRACQAAVVALFAAAYVTVGDVRSLIVTSKLITTMRPQHGLLIFQDL